MSLYDDLGYGPNREPQTTGTPSTDLTRSPKKKIRTNAKHNKIKKERSSSSQKLKKIAEQIVNNQNSNHTSPAHAFNIEMGVDSAPDRTTRNIRNLTAATRTDRTSIASEPNELEYIEKELGEWATKQNNENPDNAANVLKAVEAMKLTVLDCVSGNGGKLNLSGLNLTELPNIFQLRAIKYLLKNVDISRNKFKSLPDDFYLLENLAYIDLSQSGITHKSIPPDLYDSFTHKTGVIKIFN